MARILLDLADDDIDWLDRLAAEQGRSRAALLRDAVADYRTQAAANWIESGAGYWRGRADVAALVRRLDGGGLP